MRNVKRYSAWRTNVLASSASLLAAVAWVLPAQLKAADLGGHFIRLVGESSGVAYNRSGPVRIRLHSAADDGTPSRPVAVNSGDADESSLSFPVARVPVQAANGELAGGQLELVRMPQDEDKQQGTAKPAPRPEQKPIPRSETQKPQPKRNTRSGIRIPEQQFRSKFGRQHTFQIQQLNGNRFQAGGFIFEIVDVWPPVFSFDDPFFIDEIDEQFFLFDVNQPGVRTLVVIVQEL